jgi:putative transposase
MPWLETEPMKERVRFIVDLERAVYSMTELCARYGISRKSGYKWAERYVRGGVDGLKDQSRAPRRCPHKTSEEIAGLLLEARRKHPRWGPRTLLLYLAKRHQGISWPAPSTVGEILKRGGLVTARRRRRRMSPPGKPKVAMERPNAVWSADYKGQFRMGDRRTCYPLTVKDGYSRYLLGCQGLRSTATSEARLQFRRLFQEFGLPCRLLTDNGSPFATTGIRRLSRLSVWWIRLGIEPVLIEPGHPEQNPRHERLHRTLKEETVRPPKATLRAQQRAFDRFLHEYNEERPHQALGGKTPAEVYEPSPRPLPNKLPPMEYPGHYEVRYVSANGGIKWHNEYVFIGQALTGQHVGLEEIDDAIWSLYFGPIELGRFDEREWQLRVR